MAAVFTVRLYLGSTTAGAAAPTQRRPIRRRAGTPPFHAGERRRRHRRQRHAGHAGRDNLPDIARHFGLGLQAINDANPAVDTWVPAPGSRVLLPTQWIVPDAPRQGIVVNLAAMRLFYFPKDKSNRQVRTYPVGIGREGWSTPTGEMSIDNKVAGPTWYVPDSVRKEHAEKGDPLPAAVPPGPENPLGAYALYLSRPKYLIHGTHKPYGVGLRVSHGCLRLYPENIERLFKEVPVKTPVHIVNQPYLLGQLGDQWYLEAHTPLEGTDAKNARKALKARLKQLAAKQRLTVDWKRVDAILEAADGVAEPIAQDATDPPTVEHPERFHGAPAPVAFEPGRWYVQVLDTPNEVLAQKLAAMVNHQGPPIPALVRTKGQERYQVLAGPFPAAEQAKRARDRIQMEFELASLHLVSPKETAEPARP
ncbi:L,D-transpeptidase family protein [Methylogaea oryzae]|uniref:L,D-transpeptidase family protein n=1 Tax=Methylogaea oryzae TaxID=1295382 RepID=UPI0009E9D1DF|nr:L,D-transpeptidase family protein [Methylogaea oryzae]